MKPSKFIYLVNVCAILFLISCDKGYDVRFTNYYIEEMDSVIIGDHQIVFNDVPPETTTDFQHVTRGQHSIVLITKSNQRFSTTMFISSKGTGKRTIQIDAIKQINIFEE
ncbi:hypothetical protein [Aurantibacillus circumpalustris]|uniref:hypothetical protein n=1 Tax=Aurantibacillus circumpalustris TaxID=3036359 RepID=UPI00295B3E21|nr:hypothetical protein [Aurantibacillus circumpalustris]